MTTLKLENLAGFRADFQRLLLDSVDRDYIADVVNANPGQYDRADLFIPVLADEIRRAGYFSPRGCAEWLRGLPSALTVGYTNEAAVHFLYDIGAILGAYSRNDAFNRYIDGCDAGDVEIEDLPDRYWEKLGAVLYSLVNSNPMIQVIDQTCHDPRYWVARVDFSGAVGLSLPPAVVAFEADDRDHAIHKAPHHVAGLYPDTGSARDMVVTDCYRVHANDVRYINRIAL